MRNQHILGLALFAAVSAYAKTCTESDFLNGVKAGSFNYHKAGCTNRDGKISIKKTIVVTKDRTIIDGGGLMKLKWTGGGGCSDAETTKAIVDVKASKVLLKNFSVIEAPDGIHITSGTDNIMDAITFPKVCEDAVTNGSKNPSAAKRTIIRNSVFMNAQDKGIQVNGGSIRVENNRFINVNHPITSCGTKANPGYHGPGKCPQASRIVFRNNYVENCGDYGAQASGESAKGSLVVAIDNTFKNCDVLFRSQGHGRVYAEGNVSQGSCKKAYHAYENGSIETCNNAVKCSTLRDGSNIKEICKTTDTLEKALGWTGALD